MNAWLLDRNRTIREQKLHAIFAWPAQPIPNTIDRPLLYATVTTPHDQASLHRELARRGYVPDLLHSDDCDWWRWYHPDGARP